jgi:hypothetical protein
MFMQIGKEQITNRRVNNKYNYNLCNIYPRGHVA